MPDKWTIDAALPLIDEPKTQVEAVEAQSIASDETPEQRANVARQAAVNKTVSKLVGKVGAGVTEIVLTRIVTAPDSRAPEGYDVEEPDSDDVETLETAIAEGYLAKFPDHDVPWWLGMALAAGSMGVSMYRTRKPRAPKVEAKSETPKTQDEQHDKPDAERRTIPGIFAPELDTK